MMRFINKINSAVSSNSGNGNNRVALCQCYSYYKYYYRCLFLPVLAQCLSTATTSNGSSGSMPLFTTSKKIAEQYLPLAQKAMNYFDRSPDPFHAVQTSIEMLRQAGFQELSDNHDDHKDWSKSLIPGGKYYFTRNKSTLVAFRVGRFASSGGGFVVIGGHTDSPNLRVKTRSKRSGGSSSSCIQIGVECYGGGLWHTWFDRDLGISGRVMVRRNTGIALTNTRIEQHLIKIERPILRISNLAIHLRTEEERKAFAVNKEDHLSPILAMAAQKALMGDSSKSSDDDNENGNESNDNLADSLEESNKTESEEEKGTTSNNGIKKKDGWVEHQEPLLLQLLATELNVSVDDIVDFELSLFDVQRASLGGASSEFIYSARLDNLASCFLAVQALVEHSNEGGEGGTSGEESLKGRGGEEDIAMIVLYDHEEVGSNSAVGAASPVMGDAVDRISAALNGGVSSPEFYQSAIRKSFVLSSDQAHAVHPNYASKHEKSHQPKMNEGMVIKRNSNQRYATNGITGLLIREVAKRANLPPVQEFMVRQDCGCGSTIGPLISTTTGIRAIDMGCPQLSMHSIRETMGVCDLTHGLALFKAYFKYFREVDSYVEQ